MTYASKIDRWLIAVLAASGAVVLWAVGMVISEADDIGGWVPGLLILMVCFLPFALVFPVRYVVQEERLDVQSGLLKWHIPLQEIVEVRPTLNPLSSPALSLDRLKVIYRRGTRKKSLLISPKEKEDFLADLSRHDPSLSLENGRLQGGPA